MIENSAGWRYVQSTDTVADYPTVSEHNAAKFQDLKTNVDGKAPVSHTHSTSQVTGLDAALDGKAPVSHTHSTSQVTGLDAALDGKAPLSHTHSTSQVNGLDTALDGKAPLSHTHSTSQVNGLDEALAGKAASSDLNARVPANLALRIDTSVGTRVFAGGTMIYGDTGWRDVTSLFSGGLAASNTGQILVRRTLDSLEMRFLSVILLEGVGLLTLGQLPAGWIPAARFTNSSISQAGSAARVQNMALDSTGMVWWFSETNTSSNSPSQTNLHPSVPVLGIISAPSNGWPTSLIGIPA